MGQQGWHGFWPHYPPGLDIFVQCATYTTIAVALLKRQPRNFKLFPLSHTKKKPNNEQAPWWLIYRSTARLKPTGCQAIALLFIA